MPGHARRHSKMSCAKVAEPIEMSFGLWTRAGLRKDVLGGVRCTLAPLDEYHWTVHLRWRCGLLSNCHFPWGMWTSI